MPRCYPDTATAIGCAVALTAPQAFDGFNGIIFRCKMVCKGFVKGVAFGGFALVLGRVSIALGAHVKREKVMEVRGCHLLYTVREI